jgi:DNA-binding NarL/FixJ family response regulator
LTYKTSIRNLYIVGKKIKVLLTAGNDEDRKLIFAAITTQDDIQIIGVEEDETGTIIKSEQLKPDILIMNLQPPGIDGTVLAPIIHRRSPDTSIIMMCDRDENNYAGTALKAGISGFLLKNADMNKLLSIIRIVNLGGYYISPSIINRAIASITVINDGFIYNQDDENFISLEERRIISEIARGLSDDEIAVRLNYSAGTVKNRVTTIKRKTRLKNRLEIVIFSLVCGLIRLEKPGFWAKKNDGQFQYNTIK